MVRYTKSYIVYTVPSPELLQNISHIVYIGHRPTPCHEHLNKVTYQHLESTFWFAVTFSCWNSNTQIFCSSCKSGKKIHMHSRLVEAWSINNIALSQHYCPRRQLHTLCSFPPWKRGTSTMYATASAGW